MPLVQAHAAVHSYVIAFWICAAAFGLAALVVAALLRPCWGRSADGLAELPSHD
jgi:hypothetical protein